MWFDMLKNKTSVYSQKMSFFSAYFFFKYCKLCPGERWKSAFNANRAYNISFCLNASSIYGMLKYVTVSLCVYLISPQGKLYLFKHQTPSANYCEQFQLKNLISCHQQPCPVLAHTKSAKLCSSTPSPQVYLHCAVAQGNCSTNCSPISFLTSFTQKSIILL